MAREWVSRCLSHHRAGKLLLTQDTTLAMPLPAEVLLQIETALEALADPQQAKPMKAYMLNQFEFLGIRAGPRRSALKALPKLAYQQADLLALAEALWRRSEREFRYAAIDLLAKHHKRLDVTALPRLLQLVQLDSWWDTVDALASVMGDILLRAKATEPDIQHHMDALLSHPNLWVRRVAMLHQLGWRQQTDEARLFRYALKLGGEKDFFIRKAIGWALRDYAKTQPAVVNAFLTKYGARLSGLTVREAGKHLHAVSGDCP